MSRRRGDMITPVALAVAVHANRVFLFHGEDATAREAFYRPMGGAIAFGERAMATAERVVERDMSTDFLGARQLGVLENVYTRDGTTQHEICFVFLGAFADRQVYDHETVELTEGDQIVAQGGWYDLNQLSAPDSPRVYPDGLLDVVVTSQPPPTPY